MFWPFNNTYTSGCSLTWLRWQSFLLYSSLYIQKMMPNISVNLNNAGSSPSFNNWNQNASSSIFNISNLNNQNAAQPVENNGNSGQAVSLEQIESAGLKFVKPNRDRARWSQMSTKLQTNLLKLVNYAKSKGITISIVSGKRTDGEQQHLLRSGAPAAPKGSRHLTGRAVDIRVSGNKSQNLAILGEYWRDVLGNRWGNDFRRPKREPWHFDVS